MVHIDDGITDNLVGRTRELFCQGQMWAWNLLFLTFARDVQRTTARFLDEYTISNKMP